jgi:hypothetical protein
VVAAVNLRESARGEDCLVRIPGGCSFDPEKTILSHFPGAAGGRGRGIKALDVCAAYACTDCDAIVDRQVKPPAGMTYDDCMLCWHEGHMRTLVLWKERNQITYKGKR